MILKQFNIIIFYILFFSLFTACVESEDQLKALREQAKTSRAPKTISFDGDYYIEYDDPATYPSYQAKVRFNIINYPWGDEYELVAYFGENCKTEVARKHMKDFSYAYFQYAESKLGESIVGSRYYNKKTKKYSACISIPYTILQPITPTSITIKYPVVNTEIGTYLTMDVSHVEEDHYALLYTDSSCNNLIGWSEASDTNTATASMLYPLGPGTHKIYSAVANEGGALSECSKVYSTYTVRAPVEPGAIALESPTVAPFYDDTPELKISGVEKNTIVALFIDSTCSTLVGYEIADDTEVKITSASLEPGKTYTFYTQSWIGTSSSSCSTASVSYTLNYTNSLTALSFISPKTASGMDNRPRLKVDFSTDKRRMISLFTDSTCKTHFYDSYYYSNDSVEFDLPRLTVGSYIFYVKVYEEGGISQCSTLSASYQVLSNTRLPLTTETILDSLNLTEFKAVDINNDSKIDIIARSGDEIYSYLGNGDGTFSSSELIESVFEESTTAVFDIGDINNDSFVDIIVSVSGDFDGVKLLINNGDGSFSTSTSMSSISFNETLSVKVNDLDNDGNLDVIQFVDGSTKDIIIYKGNGDGTFGTRNYYRLPNSRTDISAVAIKDINSDGFSDIVITEYSKKRANVYLNNGDGSILFLDEYVFTGRAQNLLLKDINEDGHMDMVVSTLTKGISISLGNNDGSFADEYNIHVPASMLNNMAIADVDGDTHLDIIVDDAGGTYDRFFVLFGVGDGSFDNTLDFELDNKTFGVLAEDLNGDSKPDFIFGQSGLSVILQ
jgi:hypothetical protein